MSINVIEGPATVGSGIGKGLNRLIESKINDLHQYRKKEDLRAAIKKTNLPEWIADFPEDVQKKIFEQFELVPDEEKPKVVKAFENLGLDQEDIDNGDVENAPGVERHAEGGLYTPLDVAQQQNKQAQEQSSMPGVNSLMQAGNNQRQQGGGGNNAQMFPQMKHGTMGQANPQESPESTPQGWHFRPKSEGRGGGGGAGGLTPYQQENLNLNREKAEDSRREKEIAHQEKLQPYVDEQVQNVRALDNAAKIAKGMLENLKKNGSKWPGAFTGNLPKKVQDVLLRDPNVRKYEADSNALVTAVANSRKGNVTNLKLKLEEMSKAGLSKPKKTQIALLEDVIEKRDQARDAERYRLSLKDENGNYPRDLSSLVSEYEAAQEDPLSYPHLYEEGTVLEDDSGKHVIENGEWKDL